MTKLRRMMLVAVLGAALFSSRAQAQAGAQAQASAQTPSAQAPSAAPSGDGGWDTKYGMIFTVQNVFQNGNKSEFLGIDGVSGNIGLQYSIDPQHALRLHVNLSRDSHSAFTTDETTTLPTGVAITVKTFHAPGSDTATTADDFSTKYGVGLGADYMMRLSTAALAPYIGAGLSIGYDRTATKYTNDVDPTDVLKVDDVTSTFTLGVDGLLGVEWRVHKSISIFAEYGLGITVLSHSSVDNKDSVSLLATGTTTVETKGSHTEYVNWATAVGQQGMIGLVAYF